MTIRRNGAGSRRCPHCGKQLPLVYVVTVKETVQRTFEVPAVSQAEALEKIRTTLPQGDYRDRGGLLEVEESEFVEWTPQLQRRTAPFGVGAYEPEEEEDAA